MFANTSLGIRVFRHCFFVNENSIYYFTLTTGRWYMQINKKSTVNSMLITEMMAKCLRSVISSSFAKVLPLHKG